MFACFGHNPSFTVMETLGNMFGLHPEPYDETPFDYPRIQILGHGWDPTKTDYFLEIQFKKKNI